MLNNDDYLSLSRLSQAGYCLRRAALLMNEQIWIESSDTAKGRSEHERVHTQRIERRSDCIKLFEYEVFSDELGVSGKCDCVEAVFDDDGCKVPMSDHLVKLYPIEYKHGKVRNEQEYNIQLCAQAMCLEEMYHTSILEGAIYYITSHKRQKVQFDESLRSKVRTTASILKSVWNNMDIPAAKYGPKCVRCSLKEYCMPNAKTSADSYCRKMIDEAKGEINEEIT